MTRYLTAERFATAPYFALWESTTPNAPPVEVQYSPEVAGPVSAIRFGSVNYMATVSAYRRSEVPGIGNPLTPDPGGVVAFSTDDNYVLIGGDAANPPVLYRRIGPYYQPVAAIDFPSLPGTYALQAVVSRNAGVIAIAPANDPTNIVFLDRQGLLEKWELRDNAMDAGKNLNIMASDANGAVVQNKLKMTPDGKYLWQNNPSLPSNSYTGKFFKHNTSARTYELFLTPNNWSPSDYIVRPDGSYWFVFYNGAVYSLANEVWTQVSPALVSTNPSLLGYRFAGTDGNLLMRGVVTTANNTGRCFFVYQFTGAAYTAIGTLAEAAIPTSSYSQAMSFKASKDGRRIACSVQFAGSNTTRPLWVYEVTGSPGSFTLTRVNAYVRTTYQALRDFSPDGSRINSPGAFFTAAAPFQQLTAIPEAPGLADLSTVQTIWYGQQGQVSMLKPSTSGALLPVIRDGAGAYLDVRTLEGTFVSVWDRGGMTFRERAFIQHLVGTVVSDLQFSEDGKLFSYHTERPNLADQSGLGRLIYDISQPPFLSYRGVLREAGDVASKIAFKSDSTYAVVTFDSVTDNIKLLKFTTGYQYSVVDTQLVPYGIPAYSKCETVVVAHGGNPPYTLYNHIHDQTQDRLQQVPLPPIDWGTDSKIFLAAFMPDCSKLIIVTDEDIKLVDPETGEEEATEELEEPLDEDDEVEAEPDPDNPEGPVTIITNPTDNNDDGDGSSAGPGSGPGYETDGNSVSNISYISYAAINITFRTWP